MLSDKENLLWRYKKPVALSILLLILIGSLSIWSGDSVVSVKGASSFLEIDIKDMPESKSWNLQSSIVCVRADDHLAVILKEQRIPDLVRSQSDLRRMEQLVAFLTAVLDGNIALAERESCRVNSFVGIEIKEAASLKFDEIGIAPVTIVRNRVDFLDVLFSRTSLRSAEPSNSEKCNANQDSKVSAPLLKLSSINIPIRLPTAFQITFPIRQSVLLPLQGDARVGSLSRDNYKGMLIEGTAFIHTRPPFNFGDGSLHLAKKEELVLGDVASILDQNECHSASEGLIAIIDQNEPGFSFFLGGDIGSAELQILRSSPAAGYSISVKTTFLDKIATHPFVPVISLLASLLIFVADVWGAVIPRSKEDGRTQFSSELSRRKPYRWLKFMHLRKK